MNPDLPTSEALRMSALFTDLVVQHANMAMMFLGRAPHPASGDILRDLNAAKELIDTMEMLEVKTKGNLNAEEERLLRESLMVVRLAFVEAGPAAEEAPSNTPPPSTASAEGEPQRKRYSKKY